MKNQGNVTAAEDHNLPAPNPKRMEICDLSNKEFKVDVLRMLTELQENTERRVNEIGKAIHKQKEKFNKETETTKKNQTNSGPDEYNE